MMTTRFVDFIVSFVDFIVRFVDFIISFVDFIFRFMDFIILIRTGTLKLINVGQMKTEP